MRKRIDTSGQKREQHILDLKEKVSKLVGDPECLFLGSLKSPEAQEKFLEQILFMEELEEEPLFEQLEKEGLRLTQPEKMSDAELHAKLWETIRAMARMGHYLSSTDHLSDRELYERLWGDILREPASVSSDPSDAFCQIDLLGGCSDEDLQIRLKYYADDDERACWEGDFPEDEIPLKEPLPYDRDRYLPAPIDSCLHQ